jgi:alkylation response protein AidB-like acyl-CoA dehydrogenase
MKEAFYSYLNKYEKSIKNLFSTRYSQDEMGHERGIPPFVMNQIGRLSPSEVSIPESFGGRGSLPQEILSVLEVTSYESLALALILAINGTLFLEPVAKYGPHRLKEKIFPRFIGGQNLGGLMMTEPDYGTDALSIQTSWKATENGYTIEGQKHWAGLSGWADFWLVTARERKSASDLKREIDFFVCDSSDPRQFVRPVEKYHNLGLYMIPYARNHVDVEVPSHHRLVPVKSGIRLMQDLLHRSRMRFPGMAAGFIHRMLDEAVEHTRERFVSGKALYSYDQVQKRLSDLQADYTISSAFCRHAAGISSIGNDLSDRALEANIHKTVLSDMMQSASQSLLQLFGAKGYRLNSIAGRSVVDSRPFQIFEGSNDVIYPQIADIFLKHMIKIKEFDFFRALKSHPLMGKIADRLKKITGFSIDPNMVQRKKVDFGRIIGRITAMEWTLEMGECGYDPTLINQALSSMTERILGLLGTFQGVNSASYLPATPTGHTSWLKMV